MTTTALEAIDTPAPRMSERMQFGQAPSNWTEAFLLANAFAKSGIIPKAYQGKPEDIIIAMAHGAEVGLLPLNALYSIAVVGNKPALYGDGFMSVIVASPHYEKHSDYYVTATGEVVDALTPADLTNDLTTAVSKFWRKGIPEPFTGTFSIADAKRAGLWTKDGNWKTYPQRMLRWRARGFAGRDGFSPELRGLKLAAEVEDYAAAPLPAEVVPIAPPIRRSEKAIADPPIGIVYDAPPAREQVTEPTPETPPPARQAPPATPPAPRPTPTPPPAPPARQARPTAVIEATAADVVITDTALIQPRGADPFFEVSARVVTPGQAPLAYKFLCKDPEIFGLAQSAEGSDRVFAITWTKGARPDGSPCKVLESIASAE